MAKPKKSKFYVDCPPWYIFLSYTINQIIGASIAVIGFVGIVFVLKHFEEVLGYKWHDLAFELIGASIWMLIVGIAIIWKTNNNFIEIGKKERRR